MKYKCLRCGRYDNGPMKAHRICPVCKDEMVPVVITEEGKEKILKLFEEGRT